MQEAARWLEQNRDAGRFFLTVESFDPHEPWFVPEHYRARYDPSDGPEQVLSPYSEIPDLEPELVRRTRANYAGLVTMCDRWLGHLLETLRTQGGSTTRWSSSPPTTATRSGSAAGTSASAATPRTRRSTTSRS